MNLEFNIAVHILAFLTKHQSERYSSNDLATLTCLNPVQLRRVSSQLVDLAMIETIRGKDGGYQATSHSKDISLGKLYQHFVLNKPTNQRLFTGNEGSHCVIARNIATTMSTYQHQEHQLILSFYNQKTIQDVIADIQGEN
ncbi:Rrf2 family transcriptional regulator [Staphylococcus simiae]|uniref:redox-sensitive transcriptional regulator HypR n=1 Tax=Staphylococcus simiae TaxID=308354 RepID=UPI001A9675A2|nr:redox-sensitive transcriptional regulator HypR [Staphylococcus simiae]MBO1199594.1 Rrf2 family transcriptional regulator [Staphylococcus simiae]MBO1201628.1 Rrf2 family transcriptional regulator [Staphylococcus simiae]MBO1203748.1 Rrf2 family transcriptional regulator [Staphylococcus simiae]MBO1211603.1 Rrf2 family transcriptional regulator [Staphylococcus simiae]MBO1229989.1 Rrf2 family transcriptional regulator [Staphylococcus simiae]